MTSLLGKAFRSASNKTPVPYVPREQRRDSIFHRSEAPRDYRSALEQFGNVGALFAIVSRLAEAVSQVEWKLYRKQNDGRRRYREVETREEVTHHAALSLLRKPNPFMGQKEFIEGVQQHIDLAGEGWIVAAFNEGFRGAGPIELWPMRPDRVKIVTDYSDFLTGYLYCPPGAGEPVPLEVERVIQLRMPNPMDPYRGLGPVQSLMADLDSSRYASEYNRNFFLNSAEPGGIIEVEDRLDDDEFRELASRWREQHQGIANAHRVAILEQGKWVDRKFSMRDMMFPELSGMNSEKIREAYGFPKGMTGATEDVNKANAEANERMFARWLLVPRLERIKEALNNDLLPMFGSTAQGLEFDYIDPVPEDREADNQERITKAQASKLLVEAGYDATQVLETVGLPEMEWSRPEPAAPAFGNPSQDPAPNKLPDKPSPDPGVENG